MTPKPVIILEDITSSGFDTAFKTMHEDFEISKRIVRRLAKFHAASFYLQDEQVGVPFQNCKKYNCKFFDFR